MRRSGRVLERGLGEASRKSEWLRANRPPPDTQAVAAAPASGHKCARANAGAGCRGLSALYSPARAPAANPAVYLGLQPFRCDRALFRADSRQGCAPGRTSGRSLCQESVHGSGLSVRHSRHRSLPRTPGLAASPASARCRWAPLQPAGDRGLRGAEHAGREPGQVAPGAHQLVLRAVPVTAAAAGLSAVSSRVRVPVQLVLPGGRPHASAPASAACLRGPRSRKCSRTASTSTSTC